MTIIRNLYSVVDVATDSTTVYTGAAIVVGLVVNTALSAHALPIKDGATTVFTVPASAAAGTIYNLHNTRFNTSIVIDPDNLATGNVTLIFKPDHG